MENKEKQPLVQVKHLCKYFKVGRHAELKAVDDVSFDIYKGETVGLVGESGCGKSTTGRCMIRLYEPTKGEVIYDGKDITKLSKAEQKEFCQKVQMIFQNPYASLNSRMTVKEIVGEGLKQHGTPKNEIDKKVEALLETVGLNKDHMSRFPHEFSGGQRQRIGIARALSVDPEFIICDEPISALDVSIQAQVINMLKDLQEQRGLTYLFVAHDLSVVKYISDRVVVMYLGMIVEQAETEELYSNPQHPYTRLLFSAALDGHKIEDNDDSEDTEAQEVPQGAGCAFYPRCPYRKNSCRKKKPMLRLCGDNHETRCRAGALK